MTIYIEMISDVVCPWCWIGLRRIQAARALTPDVDTQLIFRPYELDSNIPKEGVDNKAYMRAKFGGDSNDGGVAKSRVKQMRATLIELGAEIGINFNFGATLIRPNSFDAHRLIHWAQGQDLGEQAKEALFYAYFTAGRDIGRTDELVKIAEGIGMDGALVRELLESDADVETVRANVQEFQKMGVTGVPTYLADRKLVVQGAQDADKLARFLNTAAAATHPVERPLEN